MSRCGGCALCCLLLKVEPLDKPAGVQCENSCAEGCAIWAERPPVCRGFVCLWYANESFPLALRPDKCGVFFEPGADGVMLAASKIGAWREGIAWAFIEKCLDEGTTVVVQEPAGGGTTKKHFIFAAGDTYASVMARSAEDARKRGFI